RGLGERVQPALPPARPAGRDDPSPEPVTKIVAVSATRRTDAGRERVALYTAYVRALARAGLVPMIVPPILDPDAACAALDGVQGLVLTGGEDVDPAHYHAAPHPKLGDTDAARDAVELALIAGARRRRLPILAICRGIQVLNVALGGTLYQDLATERPGKIDHADTAARHGLAVESGSLLHRTIATVATTVNTRHHQAIRDLAPGLRATAWAEDGVIEGAEPGAAGEPWLLAVQWHREAKVVSLSEAEQAPFVISGDYAQWKRVIRKELGPIAGIMQRKLHLKGSLPIVVRFVKSAEQLVEAATTVPTRFLDE